MRDIAYSTVSNWQWETPLDVRIACRHREETGCTLVPGAVPLSSLPPSSSSPDPEVAAWRRERERWARWVGEASEGPERDDRRRQARMILGDDPPTGELFVRDRHVEHMLGKAEAARQDRLAERALRLKRFREMTGG